MNDTEKKGQNQHWRQALDLGPVVAFGLTYLAFRLHGSKDALYYATATLMAASLIALGAGYWRERRLLPMPLATAVLVLLLGGLTLFFRDPTFIKMKPTAIYVFFGALLLGGLAFDRIFIKYVFADLFDMTAEGWRKLTYRFGFFALCLAVLNEVVWRNFSESLWVLFKIAGIPVLFFLFTLTQVLLLMHHQIEKKPDA